MKSSGLFLNCSLIFVLYGCQSASPRSQVLTKAEVMSQVSHKVSNKISVHELDRLLDHESNDVIVEYNVSGLDGTSQIKNKVNALFSAGEYELLRDYEAMPMNFLRIKSRTALLKLLESPFVKSVYLNKNNGLSKD